MATPIRLPTFDFGENLGYEHRIGDCRDHPLVGDRSAGLRAGDECPVGCQAQEGAAMSEIADFLRARLDEDEKDFTLRRPHTFSSADAYSGAHRHDCASLIVGGIGTHDMDCDCGYPAQVLRDIAAKRAIAHQYTLLRPFDWPKAMIETLELNVRALASVYGGHPDYRQEWKP